MNDKLIKTVLYVEDDTDDIELMESAVNSGSGNIKLAITKNGLQALRFLEETKKTNVDLPCLIILDLNMPVMDGVETFIRIKDDPKFDKIPLIVFTTSFSPRDRTFFDSKGVRMITKPNEMTHLNSILKDILQICD